MTTHTLESYVLTGTITIPSCGHISRSVNPHRAAVVNEKLQQKLKEAANISMTLNIWRDRVCHSCLAGCSYICSLQSENVLVAFMSSQGSDIEQHIAEAIESIIESNELKGKLTHIVIVNASSMKKL